MTQPLDFWENSLCGPRRNDAPFYGPEKFSLPYLTMFSFYIPSMTLPSHTLAYSVRIPSGTREIEFCRPKYPQKAHPLAPNPISASTPAPPARVPLLHLGTRGLWTLRTAADGGGHGGTGAHDLHHEEERDGGHAQLEGGAPGQRAGRRVRGARAGPLRHGVPRRWHGRPASGPAAPRARWTGGTVARGGAVGGRGGPRQRGRVYVAAAAAAFRRWRRRELMERGPVRKRRMRWSSPRARIGRTKAGSRGSTARWSWPAAGLLRPAGNQSIPAGKGLGDGAISSPRLPLGVRRGRGSLLRPTCCAAGDAPRATGG